MYDTSEKYTFFQIPETLFKAHMKLMKSSYLENASFTSFILLLRCDIHIHTCQQYSTFDMPCLASGTNFISCFGSPRGFHFIIKWKPLEDPDEIFIFYILQFIQEPLSVVLIIPKNENSIVWTQYTVTCMYEEIGM